MIRIKSSDSILYKTESEGKSKIAESERERECVRGGAWWKRRDSVGHKMRRDQDGINQQDSSMRLMIAIPRSASVLSEHVPETFCMMTCRIYLTLRKSKTYFKTDGERLKSQYLSYLPQGSCTLAMFFKAKVLSTVT